MTVAVTVGSLLAFLVLTLGTAVFVAAEFSLTTLERSAVEANARRGGRRDKYIQDAHRTLSFQLSGAQLGISITTLATGFLAEPVLARWLRPALSLLGLSESAAAAVALVLALVIATSLSMVFGELVPKNLAVALPLPTARAVAGPQLMFSRLFTVAIKATNGTANRILKRLGIEPADRLASARSPRELASLVRDSARSGALDSSTAARGGGSLRLGGQTPAELI
jgi:CBS domain containing-hemolysin-like protein